MALRLIRDPKYFFYESKTWWINFLSFVLQSCAVIFVPVGWSLLTHGIHPIGGVSRPVARGSVPLEIELAAPLDSSDTEDCG